MRFVGSVGVLLLVLVLLLTPTSFAQGASFAEGFDDVGATNPGQDGPANLIARGWIFRNQSVPEGDSSWYGSDGGQVLDPHSGTGFLAADITSTQPNIPGAAISNWAIVPAVDGQTAGTVMTFAVAGSYTGREDRLQVLYSPSGGTNTGTDADDVGDFTQVLLDVNPVPTDHWYEPTITLPGNGRIAFRYYIPAPLGAGTGWGNYFGIDSLVIGTPPEGPFPIPQSGETVTWTTEMSPVTINGRVIIPMGGTVNVEPGVEIHTNADSTLEIRGIVQGTGTDSNPIRVTADANYPASLEVSGTVNFTDAVIEGQVRPLDGGTILFDQTQFQGYATFYQDGYYFSRVPYIQITNSHFEGPNANINIGHLTLVMKNVTFHNAYASVLYTHVYLDNLDFDGGNLSLSSDGQPDYLNNITVRNSPTTGIQLGGLNSGNDFFIGPDVVLQNNNYPVGVTDGGLLPGSTLPATGNNHNAILGPGDGDYRGPVTWADMGIPYDIQGYAYLFGDWNFLPGATFRMAPGAGFEDRGNLDVRGLPDNPVTLEGLTPGQLWYRFAEPHRLEYTVMEDSQYGLIYDRSGVPNYVDSSIFRNNESAAVGAVYIRGSQFLNNTIALRNGGDPANQGPDANGTQNPNSFVGNGLAVQGSYDATHNWWGSPTGPTTPDNPGGTGDPINAGVPFAPFRTTPPDYSDHPPIVNLNEPSFLLEPGSKVMLMWSGEDDGTITGYRILFSPSGDYPSAYQLVANVPATQHAYQWTVPDIGFQVTGLAAAIRVEATDDKGQIGWDSRYVGIPSGRVEGTLTMTPAPTGSYQAGYDAFDVCWTDEGLNEYVSGIDAYLFLDGDRNFIPLGGVTTYLNCLPLTLRMPLVDTEDARLALNLHGGLNDEKWFFSEPFTIFADPRVGDERPTITLTSPQAGQVFPAGQAVPIVWESADDEALRGFEIQASFDSGRTWQVVVEDLPATARSYNWMTAPNSDLQDVRIRVIAKDVRFQNASDGAGRAFAIGATSGPTPTPTSQNTATPTITPSATPGGNPTMTPTVTPSNTPPPGATLTPTPTATVTPPGTHLLTVQVSGAGRVRSSNVAGIDCPGDCQESYSNGQDIFLEALPQSGAHFVGWQSACSGTGICSVHMTEDRTVQAVFVSDNATPTPTGTPPTSTPTVSTTPVVSPTATVPTNTYRVWLPLLMR